LILVHYIIKVHFNSPSIIYFRSNYTLLWGYAFSSIL